MPKIQVSQNTDNKTYPYTISYKCECGAMINLEIDHKPKRLPKCFNCAHVDHDLFKPTKIGKRTEKTKLKKDRQGQGEMF